MFSSSFTMSKQEHRQRTPYKRTPYKHDAPGSPSEHDTDRLDEQDGISDTSCRPFRSRIKKSAHGPPVRGVQAARKKMARE